MIARDEKDFSKLEVDVCQVSGGLDGVDAAFHPSGTRLKREPNMSMAYTGNHLARATRQSAATGSVVQRQHPSIVSSHHDLIVDGRHPPAQ